MAIPPTTYIWGETMDPAETIDYTVDCTLFLADGEEIFSYSFDITSEAGLLGLQIESTEKIGNSLKIWLSIEEEYHNDPLFLGSGTTLPLELNITTTSVPPRKRQRTLAVRVAQL